MRFIWLFFGTLSLLSGLIGTVVPLLPTVPFLLLATFCFARSSERLHHWLITHPSLGPPILHWQENGAIHPRAKRLATVSILAAFGLSLAMGLSLGLLALQASILSCVLLFIWSRPS